MCIIYMTTHKVIRYHFCKCFYFKVFVAISLCCNIIQQQLRKLGIIIPEELLLPTFKNCAISLCNGVNAPTNSSVASLIFSFVSLSSRTFSRSLKKSRQVCVQVTTRWFSSTDNAPSANQSQKASQHVIDPVLLS